MKRPIIGYGTDEAGDRFAVLDCGHRQHIRHQPPFINRPWTTTPEGRQRFLGHELNCVRCDRLELPAIETLVLEREISGYDAGNAPGTPVDWNELDSGYWVRVVLVRGQSRVVIPALAVDMVSTSEIPVAIPPQVAYRLEPTLGSTLCLEIYRVLPPAG